MFKEATLILAAISAPAPVSPELTVADGWLSLLDANSWSASWNDTGKLFRSQLTQEQWVKTVQSVREPLGTVVSRVVNGSSKSKSLPGAPDGEYEILQYRTVFSKKADTIETVILAREDDKWKIVGYFIR
ncbi:DUF4019 domain-containing protein [Sphingorhabdus sp.]|jgi:hypothetical protein|uniref:DUF4019 domain-containing protein n=1 Tax=Sphingorhabdus sp. TaxID=1902408 RepID=UPI00378417A5